jgi:hypothetical protein
LNKFLRKYRIHLSLVSLCSPIGWNDMSYCLHLLISVLRYHPPLLRIPLVFHLFEYNLSIQLWCIRNYSWAHFFYMTLWVFCLKTYYLLYQ